MNAPYKTAPEIRREVEDRVSINALHYWNGLCDEEQQQILVVGQREGVERAAEELEELAATVED